MSKLSLLEERFSKLTRDKGTERDSRLAEVWKKYAMLEDEFRSALQTEAIRYDQSRLTSFHCNMNRLASTIAFPLLFVLTMKKIDIAHVLFERTKSAEEKAAKSQEELETTAGNLKCAKDLLMKLNTHLKEVKLALQQEKKKFGVSTLIHKVGYL
ncbi:unnamed protein product [Dibothriocephalus latus]|uniref:Uncharacterized protein n=1 Tax=Dibothriocephalus latus TaxID=60516 RepID=A0A3P7LM87_DIBLA|nr:unnamed protein product [Dibothriocephalus latus]